VKGWPSREPWHGGVASTSVAGRRPDGRRRLRLVATAGVVLSLAATACAPQSPDRSSWIDQAHTALDDVSSEVATVGLLLHLQDEDKVPGKYQQVVAQDSESAVGKTMSKFSGEQPPEGEDDTYRDVTAVMSEASDLLAEVRIAIVRRATAPGDSETIHATDRQVASVALPGRVPDD
jgi:hypothetical protein